jgi:hypothetical protein
MTPRISSNRRAGVLVWAVGYLTCALATGLALAALWPQGDPCIGTCQARIDSGEIAIALVAAGGAVGLVLAAALGARGHVALPRLLALALALVLAGALAVALPLALGAGHGDEAGLRTVRSAWAWSLVVPTASLLATGGFLRLVAGVRQASADAGA